MVNNPEPNTVRELLKMIEERLWGGRTATTVILVLIAVSIIVFLTKFLLETLVESLAKVVVNAPIDSTTWIAVVLVLACLAILVLIGIIVYLRNERDRIETAFLHVDDLLAGLKTEVAQTKDTSVKTLDITKEVLEALSATRSEIKGLERRVVNLEHPPIPGMPQFPNT